MRKGIVNTTVALAASLALAGAAMGQGISGQTQTGISGQSRQAAQSGQQAGQIRPVGDIQDFTLQTSQGEKLGDVDQVVVDVERGQVGYVIVSAAQGGDKHIVPWKALRANPQEQTLTLNMGSEQFRQAPKGDIQSVMDRSRAQQIHQFYGVSPYWEERGQQRQPGMDRPSPHQDQMKRQNPMESPGQSSRPGAGM